MADNLKTKDQEDFEQSATSWGTEAGTGIGAKVAQASGWGVGGGRDETAEATKYRALAGVAPYNPNKGPLTRPGGIVGAMRESGWTGTMPGTVPRVEGEGESGLVPPKPYTASVRTQGGLDLGEEDWTGQHGRQSEGTRFGGLLAEPAVAPGQPGYEYKIPGTEGSLTLGEDWKTPSQQESMGILKPGLMKEEPYVRQEILAGGPGGPVAIHKGGVKTLADKEKEAWGGMEPPERPGDFDYNKFKQGLSRLGIPLRSKEISSLFGIALKHHEGKQQAYDEMVKAQMQYGEKSPGMVGAKATARHYDVMNTIALAKEPRDVAAALVQDMKTRAEVGGIRQKGALDEAHARALMANIDNPKLKNHITMFQADVKALGEQAIRLTPEEYKKEKDKIFGDMSRKMEGFDFAENIRQQFPTAVVPDILGPGMTFSVGSTRYEVQADGSIKIAKKKGPAVM